MKRLSQSGKAVVKRVFSDGSDMLLTDALRVAAALGLQLNIVFTPRTPEVKASLPKTKRKPRRSR
jgi:hypothetical protein